MSASAESLLNHGIAAAKAKDIQEARFYLEKVAGLDEALPDQKSSAWLWLSATTDDATAQRECLEYALACDPANAAARRGLAILDGRLKPDEQIDPQRAAQPVRPDARPETSSVRRYVCPTCGGKLEFEPNRRALTCAYCGHRLWEYEAIQQGALAREQDFAAVLPTARAQRWELPIERTLTCQSCGAAFTLPPGQATGACPFCASAHLVSFNASRELIQPDGVLPFQFDADQARQHIRNWFDKVRFRPGDLDDASIVEAPRGAYLPFWTFDIGGEARWRGWAMEGSGRNARWVARDGSHIVYHNDLLVPASHALPPDVLNRLTDFDTNALAPYTPDALAGWPTQIYHVSMADASLVARQRAVRAAKDHVVHKSLGGERVKDLTVSSLGIIVESFKLALLPVWLSGYRYKDRRYPLAINGQSGRVVGDVPRSGFQKLLAGLFGGG